MELVTIVPLRALKKSGPWQEGVFQAETSSRNRTLNMFTRPTTPRNVQCSLWSWKQDCIGRIWTGGMMGCWWESWTPPAQNALGVDA